MTRIALLHNDRPYAMPGEATFYLSSPVHFYGCLAGRYAKIRQASNGRLESAGYVCPGRCEEDIQTIGGTEHRVRDIEIE
jgi:hypothetical protein